MTFQSVDHDSNFVKAVIAADWESACNEAKFSDAAVSRPSARDASRRNALACVALLASLALLVVLANHRRHHPAMTGHAVHETMMQFHGNHAMG